MSPACQGSAGAARFAATPLTGRDMAKMGRVFRAAGRLGVPESAAAAHSMSAVTKYRETRHRPPTDADMLHQRVGRGHCCRRGRLHAKPGRTFSDPTRWREGGTIRRASHDGISQAARGSLASVPRCPHFVCRGLVTAFRISATRPPSFPRLPSVVNQKHTELYGAPITSDCERLQINAEIFRLATERG